MVEGTALEMRRTRKGTVGSNPTLSAKKRGPLRALFLGGLGSVDDPLFDMTADRRSWALGARGALSDPRR